MTELTLVEELIIQKAKEIKELLKQLPSLGFFVDLGSADFTKQGADMCCYLIERFMGYRLDENREWWDQGYLSEKCDYVKTRVQCIGKDIKAALSQNVPLKQ
jgi:hypothetical protein